MHRSQSHLRDMQVQGSQSYVWNVADCLGSGATAMVYLGSHKTTGEPAAIKVFTASGGVYSRAQANELELFKRLDHENVVKLLAIENEIVTKNQVAVMEYCAGKSLLSILNNPENVSGLNENEFLLALTHTVAGLKYLRNNSISHRDIKPGNTVLYITDDGRHIYKLTDFGAAKTIEDDECFHTICGTPGYLSPDLYERAIIKMPKENGFSPKVDLWSMGCTIYQIATGSLPFKCIGGPTKPKTMQWIFENKRPGVISCNQNENGEVEWSEELPQTCLLSQGLKELVTPILENLLERDTRWGFQDFFSEVEKLQNKKVIHVLDVHTCSAHTLYLDPEATIQAFREQLQVKTKVPVENQLLILKGCPLEFHPNAQVCHCIENTSSAEPILLLTTSSLGVKLSTNIITPANIPECGVRKNFDNYDVEMARNVSIASYTILRKIETMTECHNLLLQVPTAIKIVINGKAGKLLEYVQQSLDRISILKSILRPVTQYVATITEVFGFLKVPDCPEIERLQVIIQQMKEAVSSNKAKIHVVRNQGLAQRDKFHENSMKWQQQIGECQRLTGRKETADTHVQTIRLSLQKIVEFHQKAPLSQHEASFNKLEKEKINTAGRKLLAVHKECCEALKFAATVLDSGYIEIQAAFEQFQCLTSELNHSIVALKNFEGILKNSECECEELVRKLISTAKGSLSNHVIAEAQTKGTTKHSQTVKSEELEKSQNELNSSVEIYSTSVQELQSLVTHLIEGLNTEMQDVAFENGAVTEENVN